MNELRDSVQRLEEKLFNAESENQVLRQKSLTMTPTTKPIFAGSKTMIAQKSPQNGNVPNREATLSPNTMLSVCSEQSESEDTLQRSLNEKQQEYQDLLIKCISQNLGFSGGKPIAACLMYKCLLHWMSLEVERTSIFECIIETIGSAIEVQDNSVLAYWLSNTSILLFLFQQTLKATGAASLTPQQQRTMSTLFGRISSLRASPHSVGPSFLNGQMLNRSDGVSQVEVKYPALLFKQQLTAFLEKIYGMIRDNLKKEISPLLGLCIQAHGCPSLSSSKKVFSQIFSFVNVQLFNSLLLRRECCSFSNGEYVKAGLAELEQWCYDATKENAGSAWDNLKHIRQAVGFLVMHQKTKKTLNEVLSIQQLFRISTMYWDDKYGTHTVSSDISSPRR